MHRVFTSTLYMYVDAYMFHIIINIYAYVNILCECKSSQRAEEMSAIPY